MGAFVDRQYNRADMSLGGPKQPQPVENFHSSSLARGACQP